MIDEFIRESNKIEEVYDDDSFDQAKWAWKYLRKQKEMSRGVVLKAHKILMLHQGLKPDEKGYFRKVPVWVGRQEGIDHTAIRGAIDDLCIKMNQSSTEEEIKQDHVSFEKIHGFCDGNGRLGRLLMNWQRLKAGLPILVIKSAERQKYYEWFR